MGTIHNLRNEPDQTTPGSRKVPWNFCALFELAKILPEKIFSAKDRSFIAKICRFGKLENQQTLFKLWQQSANDAFKIVKSKHIGGGDEDNHYDDPFHKIDTFAYG